MHEMALFVIYTLFVCLAVPLVIGIVLSVPWRKQDKLYSERMDTESYVMQHGKINRAACIAIIAFGISISFFPVSIPGFRAVYLITSFLLGGIFILFGAISLYDYTKWKVAISGDIIEANIPFRTKHIFRFDEINYATEEQHPLYSDSRRRTASYHVYIKDPQGKDIRAFVVTTAILGYETFALQLRAAGKINELKSKYHEKVFEYKHTSWIFIFLATIAIIGAMVIASIGLYDIVTLTQEDTAARIREFSRERMTIPVLLAVLSVILYIIAIIRRNVGKKKAMQLLSAHEEMTVAKMKNM